MVAALVQIESAGVQNDISSQGAVGLMQVMPCDGIAASFECINGPCFADRPNTDQLLDPNFNLNWGSKFLAGKISAYGLRDGLKLYGPQDVGYSYADDVINLYNQLKN
ncbi:lytic transglycosylase domain-containing protein [Patescibacteria group bacterium]|nr:lytic transglycosylase domain-containing protein [Patescibacteria group bacterium]